MVTSLCNATNDYLADNNSLRVAQHDSRNHSTKSLLLISQHNYVNYSEDKAGIDVIFYFRKAFDAVNHEMLLLKIRAFWFC